MALQATNAAARDLTSIPIISRARVEIFFERVVLIVIAVALWWASSLSLPHYILPGPVRVWQALQLIAGNGDLWSNLLITLWRVTIGFVMAALLGLPFGIILGANKRAGDFFEPII